MYMLPTFPTVLLTSLLFSAMGPPFNQCNAMPFYVIDPIYPVPVSEERASSENTVQHRPGTE